VKFFRLIQAVRGLLDEPLCVAATESTLHATICRSSLVFPVPTSYNQIAGQSVERLATLNGGIFAMAMTLLVLNLRTPAAEAIHSGQDLQHALVAISLQIVMYMMSLMTLDVFWAGQQTHLNFLDRSHRGLAWIRIGFIFAVALTPFSTRLLADFIVLLGLLDAYFQRIGPYFNMHVLSPL
jgi:uncharacterized membrane protein